MQSLTTFLQSEVGGNPIKAKQIPDLLELIGAQIIISVRGDGNCIIRAIKRAIGVNDEPFDYNEFRNQIVAMWDYQGEFDGNPAFHFDDSCIDGLAVNMVMRILGVKTLNIFQCFDGAGRKAGWRTIEVDATDLFVDRNDPKCANLLTVNGCHYAALVL